MAGSAAITALVLSSCGAPALTLGEAEVKVSKAFISDLESAWDAHRETQPASNLGADAGCFVGAVNGEMTGAAFCGPVRYLGEDETGWDEILVDVVDNDGKAEPEPRGTYTVGPLEQDMELVRHDNRSPVRDLEVSEPDAPNTARPLVVFSTDENLPTDPKELAVELPQGLLNVTAASTRERAGGATDRTAAPEGFRIASVSFDAVDLDRVPENGSAELSFQVDGKAYPFDDRRDGGTVSIAVPEGSEVFFGVTFDGVTQFVSVPDLTLDAGDASALYAPKWESVVIDEKVTGDAAWRIAYANRSAHTPAFDLGWAGKDQVWIKSSVTLGSLDGLALKKSDGMKVVSAVMTTADGAELEASKVDLYYWGSKLAWTVDGFYKAPADTAETSWNLTLEDGRGNVHVSGPMTMGAERDSNTPAASEESSGSTTEPAGEGPDKAGNNNQIEGPNGTVIGNNDQTAPIQDWGVVAEDFAIAWADTSGGKDAWLERLDPLITDELHDSFTYTDIRALYDDTFVSITADQEDQMAYKTFTARYETNGDLFQGLITLQSDGSWKVDTIAPPEE